MTLLRSAALRSPKQNQKQAAPMQKIVPLSSPSPADFTQTHCSRCHAGWTRQFADGSKTITCILDRKVVQGDMTSCDRFMLRED
jgi:hypothetical protein